MSDENCYAYHLKSGKIKRLCKVCTIKRNNRWRSRKRALKRKGLT